MDNYPVTRTAEQGHTAACLAQAMIAAIENMRDSVIDDCTRMGMGTETSFRLMAQDNTALEWADIYLTSGTTICHCPS